MNPFDLPGPQFLGFYLVFAAVVLVLSRLLQRRLEGGDAPPAVQQDPYAIAYLRGGPHEVLRVATLSLVDRGLLQVEDGQLRCRDADVTAGTDDTIEQAVLRICATPQTIATISGSDNRALVRTRYRSMLQDAGLLPGPQTLFGRLLVFATGAGGLWLVAGYKLWLAAQRGRSNVAFLWLLALLATALLGQLMFRPRTSRADRAIAGLRALFAGLRGRAALLRGGSDPAAMLHLAAVFGVAAVPLAVFPHRTLLGPERPLRAEQATNCSACGSSGCGSSCGGGCGGGCGGCGS